ncbi:MAG: ATP-dependent Clp protease ATP-binding subunit [Simkaniaceae bacterium]|nr:MAG: ATP-dependent Clp protease ATP-binding subunit [Simkaniaceae bacterium]
MAIGQIHCSLLLSPTVQLLSKAEPTSSTLLPLFMMTSGQLSWLNAGKVGIAASLALHEAFYFSSRAPTRQVQVIHECTSALFINSVVKAYQEASWKPIRPLILYAPLFASIAMSHPIFQVISEITPKDSEEPAMEELQSLLKKWSPFVFDREDFTDKELSERIHALNPMDKNGRRPYKIFTLSLSRLRGQGDRLTSLLHETFDYLKTQGQTILIINPMDLDLKSKIDSSFLQFISTRENYTGVQIIGVSSDTKPLNSPLTLVTREETEDSLPPDELTEISADASPILYDIQREEAQQIVEVIGNKHGMHNVCLVADEEGEKEYLMQTIAYLLKKAKPPLNEYKLFEADFQSVIDKTHQQKLLDYFISRPNAILFLTGIESGFIIGPRGEEAPHPLLRMILALSIKVIISTTPEQFSTLQRDSTAFAQGFFPHKMLPLPQEEQSKLFDKELEKYPTLEFSGNTRENLLKIVGPCTIREQLSLLGQVASIMTQRECTEDVALEVITQQTAHRSKSFLPPNLIELTASPEEVICLNRDREILEVLITLHSRDGKNNVCLVGEAGCGKTQMVRHIASQIRQGAIEQFRDYRVFNFSISSIMSDSTYIGMWQGKLKKILDYCSGLGKVIIFIDEIHLAIGNGKSVGNDTMDIAQMMKEYITNPNLRVIGATTPDEYYRYVKSDPAFADRFKTISLPPLSEEDQLAALEAHSIKHSPSDTPLDRAVLVKILSETGSLRTSVGRVAEIHSYMSYMGNDDVPTAVDWTLGRA